ncbi:type I-F CRISPR-associated endoribonuclease Cas6/Csy4 [Gynuella sp.]|uniref:type I-F CRISPR-associated endoribonuclease Cas6/Csy4 n=1 Tax=Gynuella sp. TaxID=2969146 RepID=UPI003D0A58AD
MDHYIDIKLMPDPEFPLPVLMNSLYSKFHKALCDIRATRIGVSFPSHQKSLGNLLRLHATAAELDTLMSRNWIGAMIGYCQISNILPVPPGVGYRTVSRRQPNMTSAKLRRLLKKGKITQAEVNGYVAKMNGSTLDNPYLELTSASSGHKYLRFIQLGPITDTSVAGEFDQFGLSKTATIPWFTDS